MYNIVLGRDRSPPPPVADEVGRSVGNRKERQRGATMRVPRVETARRSVGNCKERHRRDYAVPRGDEGGRSVGNLKERPKGATIRFPGDDPGEVDVAGFHMKDDPVYAGSFFFLARAGARRHGRCYCTKNMVYYTIIPS